VRNSPVAAAALSVAVAMTACSSSLIGPLDEISLRIQSIGGVEFMTQNVVSFEAMDALYEGPVILDEAGCLRLGDAEGSTVIWPWGFTAQVAAEEVKIRDREGAVAGLIGESFSLGGGVVQELLDSLGFTQEDRELAAGACPGDYWIVQ
jgi:hypothetical protein